MAFKRPVAGDPVTVEDFGQPVYDFIVKQSRTGGGWKRAGSPQHINNAVVTAITYLTTDAGSTAGMMNMATGVVTIPVAGLWAITLQAQLTASPNARAFAQINLMGTGMSIRTSYASVEDSACPACVVALAANATFQTEIYTAVAAGSDVGNAYLTAFRVGD